MTDKETIYDTEIFPLMDKIIDICHKNKIAMLCHFEIPSEQDPTLAVTTLLGNENGVPSHLVRVRAFLMAGSILHDHELIQRDDGGFIISDKKCVDKFRDN
jgi:hypothetical protein